MLQWKTLVWMRCRQPITLCACARLCGTSQTSGGARGCFGRVPQTSLAPLAVTCHLLRVKQVEPGGIQAEECSQPCHAKDCDKRRSAGLDGMHICDTFGTRSVPKKGWSHQFEGVYGCVGDAMSSIPLHNIPSKTSCKDSFSSFL